MMDDLLTILSRHGWDRVGDPRRLPWEFRRGDEDVSCMPGELAFWVADLEPVAPTSDAEWHVVRRWGCGFVESRSGRHETGITHDRAGQRLFFPRYDEAETAARALNLRDGAPRQTRLEL